MSITKAEMVELHHRIVVAEIDRLLAIPVTPPVTGNAKVIAKWPTYAKSSLTVRGYVQVYAPRIVW